jgi:colanic acid/amylovoran biosynthesis glycosyltransferase
MLKLRALAQRGVDVYVGSFPRTISRVDDASGVRLVALPDLRGGPRAVTGALRHVTLRDQAGWAPLLSAWRRGIPSRFWELYVQLARLPPGILHFEWLSVATTCLPMLRRWSGPVVVSCRGSELTGGEPLLGAARSAVLPALFRRADAVHVVSEAKRDEALPHGLDPAKAVVIRPAVDADAFRPPTERRSSGKELAVVSVAGLRWLKGYEYALMAVAELLRDGVPVTLQILGGDPDAEMYEPSQRSRILHTARDLGLDGRVQLLGAVSPRNVAERLRQADVFLHTSLTEGLPNVVLEAMSCGLAVVATDVGGTSEALREGVEGFLVPPRDAGAVAAALRKLWRNPELRTRLGHAARARVEAEFTIERQTRQWLDLYDRVAH